MTTRHCQYELCGRDLDSLPRPVKATAKFCNDAHRKAQARMQAERADDAGLTHHDPTSFWRGIRHAGRPSRGVAIALRSRHTNDHQEVEQHG